MSEDKQEGAATPVAPRRRRRRYWIAGIVAVLFAVWYLGTDFYAEEEKELRTQVREAVKESFPEEAAEYAEMFGLTRLEQDGEPCRGPDVDRGSVVLVHGLDDPGVVWRSLAPVLCQEAYDVWVMEYPNDQPIAESAVLLAEELKTLLEESVDRVSIVTHSMGGLVTREMLTSPDVAYLQAARDGVAPEVDLLVMVGTPNHGASVARFRVLGEWRDQLSRMTEGAGSWLGGILDGAGEAKIDLLPESRFLTELNARPQPEDVEMLIIAGVASPWSEGDIERWVDAQSQDASADERERVAELGAGLVAMTRGVGDGLVSLESTRLPGVEHLSVDGTHVSMIRTLTEDSERVPPALPIVLERLEALGSGGGAAP